MQVPDGDHIKPTTTVAGCGRHGAHCAQDSDVEFHHRSVAFKLSASQEQLLQQKFVKNKNQSHAATIAAVRSYAFFFARPFSSSQHCNAIKFSLCIPARPQGFFPQQVLPTSFMVTEKDPSNDAPVRERARDELRECQSLVNRLFETHAQLLSGRYAFRLGQSSTCFHAPILPLMHIY